MNIAGLILFVKKQPVGVGCAGLALLLLVLTFTRHGTLLDLDTQLIEQQDQADRLKNNLRYSTHLASDLETLQQAVAGVEAKTINPASLATNLQFFYRLEQELGLKLVDLRQESVPESKTPSEYISVPYVVAVEGTHLQLLDFIQRLEEGGRIVKFVSLSLNPSRGSGDTPPDPYDPRLVLTLDLALLGRS